MATGDTKVTRSFLELDADGTAAVDFNSDTVKMMLVKSAHTPNYTTDVYAASLTTNQVTLGTDVHGWRTYAFRGVDYHIHIVRYLQGCHDFDRH